MRIILKRLTVFTTFLLLLGIGNLYGAEGKIENTSPTKKQKALLRQSIQDRHQNSWLLGASTSINYYQFLVQDTQQNRIQRSSYGLGLSAGRYIKKNHRLMIQHEWEKMQGLTMDSFGITYHYFPIHSFFFGAGVNTSLSYGKTGQSKLKAQWTQNALLEVGISMLLSSSFRLEPSVGFSWPFLNDIYTLEKNDGTTLRMQMDQKVYFKILFAYIV